MRKSRFTDAQVQDMRRRREAGYTLRGIALVYGCAENTVWYWLKQSSRERREKPKVSRSRTKTVIVMCLKCGRLFSTPLAGRLPEKRICPNCVMVNMQYAGSLV